MRIIQFLATLCFLIFFLGLGALFFLIQYPIVDFSRLVRQHGQPSIVLDDTGTEIMRFQLDRRDPIPLDRVPVHVIQAFLAAEDRSFYEHGGISWRAIARSAIKNMYYGRRLQGASTITQQLVKLFFLDSKKIFSRKIKEQILALIIERNFTKNQILEAYLNHIYFGNGIYGIEAAAQRFWGKHVQDLSIDESAVLAGIIRLPRKYCPLDNPKNALLRRNVVLACMRDARFIDRRVYEDCLKRPLSLLDARDTNVSLPHVREMVRIFAEALVGKHLLYTGGLTIQTTINRSMQDKAQRVFTEKIGDMRKRINADIDGALISVETDSGAIKALIGGYDYCCSQFNRVYARRQMASMFKLLIYAVAVEQGSLLTDIMIDEPIHCVVNEKVWAPQNAQKKFLGSMTLVYAFTHSNNSIPIRLLLQLGYGPIIHKATLCHLTCPLQCYPSLALGCVESTPLEVVGMFNVFANRGTYVKPYLIKWVKDASDQKIWKHTAETNQVFDWGVCSQIAKGLAAALPYWKRALGNNEWLPVECIGKSGTTNDARTCWFAGSTPAYTTVVYLGRDDNVPLGKDAYGMRMAMPLWLAFNQGIKHTRTHFAYDPRLIEVTVCAKSGKPVENNAIPDGEDVINLLVPAAG